MSSQVWSLALTIIGVVGFKLAGKKVWWAWYINIANQAIWVAYAIFTRQWGFLLGVPFYLAVFIPNATEWTRDRHRSEPRRLIGTFDSIEMTPEGIRATGHITDPNVAKQIQEGSIGGLSIGPFNIKEQ